jgi:ubiquinone/menaquinone biosynthesis C-methylase UbiE
VLARRGARVTGVDFSPVALAKAADLAERCGVKVEWVQADAAELPHGLDARFDLAYATIGAIGWIEDIGAWMPRSPPGCGSTRSASTSRPTSIPAAAS